MPEHNDFLVKSTNFSHARHRPVFVLSFAVPLLFSLIDLKTVINYKDEKPLLIETIDQAQSMA